MEFLIVTLTLDGIGLMINTIIWLQAFSLHCLQLLQQAITRIFDLLGVIFRSFESGTLKELKGPLKRQLLRNSSIKVDLN